MLLREILQGRFNFCNGNYDRHAVAVMVGEFYELLAQQIFGGERIDPALENYINSNQPSSSGLAEEHHFLPDLYCRETKIGSEIKGAQKRTAHPLRVDQLERFRKLLKENCKFERIRYVFFRYETREPLNRKNVNGIVDLLAEKTCLMAVVDLSVIASLVECAERWETEYVLTGYSNNSELYRIKQKFFDDLILRPRELLEHLGIARGFVLVRESEEKRTFFEREMRFKRVEISVGGVGAIK